jgi:hypothetical protein
MASTIMRSELMGRKLTGHVAFQSNSLIFRLFGFNIYVVTELRCHPSGGGRFGNS